MGEDELQNQIAFKAKGDLRNANQDAIRRTEDSPLLQLDNTGPYCVPIYQVKKIALSSTA